MPLSDSVSSRHDRVRLRTDAKVRRGIDRSTRASIRAASADGTVRIKARIRELDREWDVDRALMLNFALVGGAALALGQYRNPRWLGFLAVQLGFLAHHAIRGWCPPLPVFRRLGFRTQREIDEEKFHLLERLRA